jgi:hypothetical protein
VPSEPRDVEDGSVLGRFDEVSAPQTTPPVRGCRVEATPISERDPREHDALDAS